MKDYQEVHDELVDLGTASIETKGPLPTPPNEGDRFVPMGSLSD
ncbi:benenodin family lasso peptide [Brevundimonas sp.]|nr:benenodin family lasso peptide [Brevundimonas sp.]